MWKKFKKLGSGQYGSVYLAVSDNPLLIPSFEIAMKTATLADSITLRREAEFLRKLKGNQFIVQCYGEDISLDENNNYEYNLLMEVASRGSLDDLIKGYKGIMPESHVAFYTHMLLKGISAIHRNKMVHCDIKPANILIFPSPDGGLSHLKIADFGLSKMVYEVVDCKGTPYYAPPETMMSGIQEKSADIWSLGCTVLKMMNGGKHIWKKDNRWEAEIPEHVSEVGKDFLKRCFECMRSRWTADKLLNHPFVIPPPPPPGFEFRDMLKQSNNSNPVRGYWSVSRGMVSPGLATPEEVLDYDECYQLFSEEKNRELIQGNSPGLATRKQTQQCCYLPQQNYHFFPQQSNQLVS